MHRAYVVAPGGAWSWSSDQASADDALRTAREQCAEHTPLTCQPYAVDDAVVFDSAAWAAGLGPYASARDAAARPLGVMRGQRFPALKLTAPDGREMRLDQLRGKVVFLHFWAAWCPPCKLEFPDVMQLFNAVR
ncbi:MAG: TlpA family protein disulfide reductase, partial [Alphaproteobacteria bacterium]|nr:TlpA family protein disulfide reductase [Alphaproteobacteria bacterium]